MPLRDRIERLIGFIRRIYTTKLLLRAAMAGLAVALGFAAVQPASAQIALNGTASGSPMSGGIDINQDGVFTDGTWSGTTNPGASAIKFHDGGLSIIEQLDVSTPSTGTVVFTPVMDDPDVKFSVYVRANTGLDYPFEQSTSQYTITWNGGSGGLATLSDPANQIIGSSVTSSAGSISFMQGKPPLSAGDCAYTALESWRNRCLEWQVNLPIGATDVQIVASGGTAAEGFFIGMISQADLIVNKTVSSPIIGEGETGSFTITVKNENIVGNSAATSTALVDLLPAGVTYTSHSISTNGTNSGGSYNSTTGDWAIGKLGLGETATLTLNFTVDAGQGGNIVENTIAPESITMAQTDPTSNNGNLSAQFTASSTKIGIAKSQTLNADEDGSTSITVGDTLTYEVVATNTGTTTLSNVVVSDPKITPNSITCATLAPSATCTLTGTHVITTAEADAGKIDNTGSVTSTEIAGPTTTPTVTTTIIPTIIPVTESGSGTTTVPSVVIANVRSNDTINKAAATTSNSTIAISGGWPSGFSLDTTTGAISIDASVAPGTYDLTYQLCDLKSPANCATVQDQVVISNVIADVHVTKSNGANEVVHGETTTYAIMVTNDGPGAVTGTVVKDTPGYSLTCASNNSVTITGSGVPAGSYTIGDLTGTGITLGTLADGEAATLAYNCTVS